jgi:hypothetical protein
MARAHEPRKCIRCGIYPCASWDRDLCTKCENYVREASIDKARQVQYDTQAKAAKLKGPNERKPKSSQPNQVAAASYAARDRRPPTDNGIY